VANSGKEISQLKQTTNLESSNPAMTQTANARTWQPGIDPDHQPAQPYNLPDRVPTKN
ncbi:MAG: hypothetical protein QOD67_3504, partial [Caballeronia sp.]|nr:hypothetical protein [Caballeronia sp.]